MNRFGIYLVAVTSVTAAFTAFCFVRKIPKRFGCCIYRGTKPREGEIAFRNPMAFRQEKDYEAAGESKIFMSLFCSNIQMFSRFLIWGSSSSAPGHFNCAGYIEQAEPHGSLAYCLFLKVFLFILLKIHIRLSLLKFMG